MAAAAFSERDREGEGDVTGVMAAAAVTEWKEEEHFGPLCGYSFVLKQATDRGLMELTAMPESATGLMFRAQFDGDALVSAGFVGSVDFDSRLKMLRGALSGDAAVTTTVTAHSSDAIDVNITVPVADYFSLHIKLTLGCAPLDKTQVLKARLSEAVAECHSLKLQLAEAKTEMKDAVAVGDATKQQLADARAKVEALSEDLECCQTQLGEALAIRDTTKKQLIDSRAKAAKLSFQLDSNEAELAECRARMSAMEKRVSDLKRQLKHKTERVVSRSSDSPFGSSAMTRRMEDPFSEMMTRMTKSRMRRRVVCDCGATMQRCEAEDAYIGLSKTVGCDKCGEIVGGRSEVYHCPRGKCFDHSGGFDYCLECA